MDPSRGPADPPVPEHFLAVSYGLVAGLLGASVWSGFAAVFDGWSLLVAPGVGWLTAWACSYGARRPDDFSRSAAWVLAALGIVVGLVAYGAFSVAHASPDDGLTAGALGTELLRLVSAPPWFASAAVLLALAGVPRALAGEGGRAVVMAFPERDEAGAPGDEPVRESRAA
jgi:hypothetical protein